MKDAYIKVDHENKAKDCSDCNGKPTKTMLVNHSEMWHDGDVVCAVCGRFVRYWDAG